MPQTISIPRKGYGTIATLLTNHPLIGHWRADGDDGRSEYTVRAAPSGLTVMGKDFLDGEKYEITNVTWTEQQVIFDTLIPSTGRKGHMVLTASDRKDI